MSRIYRITGSGLQPLVVKDYAIGCAVRYTGDMANQAGIGAIVAIRPASQFGPKSYDVALTDGRQFCGTHLDGSRWEVSDSHVEPETVGALRAGVAGKEATDKASKSATDHAFAQAVEKLRRDYPQLQQGSGPTTAAKNIRTELKHAFHAIKFSVRTSQYSGGNSVNVSWEDGPAVQQVERITGKYAGGHFDGMTDSYEYKRSPWTEVYGEARYVFCNRDYSDKMLACVMRRVCERLGGMDKLPSVEDYKQGRLWQFKQSGGCDVEREIGQALARHTYCVGGA